MTRPMRWLDDVWFRTRAVFGRASMERDLSEELSFHLDMEAEKYRARGMSAEEARREARLKFGGEERFKERARESWGVSLFTDLAGDLRFAGRQMRKSPAFTAVAVLTLALGIGGTVALFSVVYGIMLRPLPIPDEDHVVAFWMEYSWRGEEFDLVRAVPEHFESLAAFSNDGYTLRTESGSSLVLATVSSVELWDVIETQPFLGRTFLPGEDRPGSEPVVVLGHGIWQREFGSDREILGRSIDLNGTATTVVGVMPQGFYFPSPEMEIFVPLDLDPARRDYASNGWLALVGRVRPASTSAQITGDLNAITTVLGERYSYSEAFNKTRNPFVIPLREYLFGEVRPALLLLFSAVGLLLLMACVNVTALVLTRTADRIREMSVRAALGAGRARLARQVLTESVVLGLFAGVIGMGLAAGLFDLLVSRLPIDPAFRATLGLDWTALLAALVLAVVTGSAIALAPMRNLLKGRLHTSALTSRSESGGASHTGRLHNTLVAAEVLLAVVLVTGASLLVRTVGELRDIDPGLDVEGVLAVDILVSEEETTEADRVLFFEALVEQATRLPGVSAAGLTNRLPLRDGGYQGPADIQGRSDLEGVNRPNIMYRTMTPEMFEALGLELVQGRGIEATDGPEGPFVAVINESFARRIWAGEDPIGATYATSFTGPVQVVGIVRNAAVTDLVGEQPMAAYYPWRQAAPDAPYGILLVKTEGDPAALSAPLRSMIRELEPRAAVGTIQTMADVLDAEMAEPLRLRLFLGIFSFLGIVLGTVGVYGVVSYSVQRRSAEFGIRMALGAHPSSLLGAVIRSGMAPVALGVAGGTVVALLATRALSSFLFGVQPTDPLSVGTAGAVLLAAGAVAALIPALRASTTDPALALRAE